MKKKGHLISYALNFICPLFLFEAGSEQVQHLIFRLTPLFFMFLWLKKKWWRRDDGDERTSGDPCRGSSYHFPESYTWRKSWEGIRHCTLLHPHHHDHISKRVSWKDWQLLPKKSPKKEKRDRSHWTSRYFLLFLRHHQVHHQNLVFSFLSLSSPWSCILRQFSLHFVWLLLLSSVVLPSFFSRFLLLFVSLLHPNHLEKSLSWRASSLSLDSKGFVWRRIPCRFIPTAVSVSFPDHHHFIHLSSWPSSSFPYSLHVDLYWFVTKDKKDWLSTWAASFDPWVASRLKTFLFLHLRQNFKKKKDTRDSKTKESLPGLSSHLFSHHHEEVNSWRRRGWRRGKREDPQDKSREAKDEEVMEAVVRNVLLVGCFTLMIISYEISASEYLFNTKLLFSQLLFSKYER